MNILLNNYKLIKITRILRIEFLKERIILESIKI